MALNYLELFTYFPFLIFDRGHTMILIDESQSQCWYSFLNRLYQWFHEMLILSFS